MASPQQGGGLEVQPHSHSANVSANPSKRRQKSINAGRQASKPSSSPPLSHRGVKSQVATPRADVMCRTQMQAGNSLSLQRSSSAFPEQKYREL
jgi:hypothetical protein